MENIVVIGGGVLLVRFYYFAYIKRWLNFFKGKVGLIFADLSYSWMREPVHVGGSNEGFFNLKLYKFIYTI